MNGVNVPVCKPDLHIKLPRLICFQFPCLVKNVGGYEKTFPCNGGIVARVYFQVFINNRNLAPGFFVFILFNGIGG